MEISGRFLRVSVKPGELSVRLMRCDETRPHPLALLQSASIASQNWMVSADLAPDRRDVG